MRELTELKIQKISIVGSPANKKSWLLKKSEQSEDVVEITIALKDFFGADGFDPDEISKETNKKQLLQTLEMLKPFREDMPDNFEDSINLLVKCAASAYFSRPKVEKEDEDEPDEEDEEDEEDPVIMRLKRIEKKLAGKDEKIDPFPSIYLPLFSNKMKKSDPDPEPESKKTGPRKTSIDGQESEIFVIEKEDDSDPWPSIFDATIFRSS